MTLNFFIDGEKSFLTYDFARSLLPEKTQNTLAEIQVERMLWSLLYGFDTTPEEEKVLNETICKDIPGAAAAQKTLQPLYEKVLNSGHE